jgi:pimeloyl-ACP methyl ester carboxylesterase
MDFPIRSNPGYRGVWLVALVALAVLASACLAGATSSPAPPRTATAQPTAGPTAAPAERYERFACPFDVPTSRFVECGYLTVPENRSRPGSRNIRLAVAVMKSDTPAPRADPIVYLEGGPGGSALEVAYLAFEDWFAPFVADRDIILFDQRGVGHSKPALDCPQFNDAFRKSVEEDIRREALTALVLEATRACHARLVASGADLSGYNSAESATDLDELRQALGYEAWNLYGISYGTRLALTTMRDHRQGIRSVILDSSYPPDADLYASLLPNAQRAFDKLFEGCAADAGCASAYPELRTVFFELVDRLNAQPADLPVENFLTGEVIPSKMNGDLLIAATFQALYSSGSIPYLPGVIYAANDGFVEALTPLLGDLFFTFDTVSSGMHYAVQCHEEVPFGSAEAVAAAAAAHPDIRHGFELEPVTEICEDWDTGPVEPKENQPVESDTPTLVLAGEYDPITPPSWGEQVARTLSRGYFFTFPGVGHGATVSPYMCPVEIALAFLESPEVRPDGSCIASMTGPEFQ